MEIFLGETNVSLTYICPECHNSLKQNLNKLFCDNCKYISEKETIEMKCEYCNSHLLEVHDTNSGNYLCCSNNLCQRVYHKMLEEESPILQEFINKNGWKEHKPMKTETTRAASDKVGTGLILIPLYSLLALGKIFIEGLRYGKDNWKKGVHDKEYQEERLEHALLHLIKYKEGDRSEAHLAKVAWFCFTQLELERLEQPPIRLEDCTSPMNPTQIELEEFLEAWRKKYNSL